MIAEQPADLAYRQLYYYLHKVVDQAIGRILDSLEASGMADDTIVVFTSDHGDLLGAHGGLQQKWCNAFDEATRVPMIVTGPGDRATPPVASRTPTSHVDLIPTLMGLAGIDVERAAAGVAAHHAEARPLPGRDLSGLLTGKASPASVASADLLHDRGRRDPRSQPDQHASPASRSRRSSSRRTSSRSSPRSRPVTAAPPSCGSSTTTTSASTTGTPTTASPPNPFAAPAAEPVFEMHNLTADPEERHNRAERVPGEAEPAPVHSRQPTRRQATASHTSQSEWLTGVDARAGPPDCLSSYPARRRDGRSVNLFVAIVIVVTRRSLAIVAMLWVRRRAPDGSYFNDGDRAAGVFGVLATGFAVLLGFVVFLAFTSYDSARAGAETEARIVAQQVETAQLFPPAVSAS